MASISFLHTSNRNLKRDLKFSLNLYCDFIFLFILLVMVEYRPNCIHCATHTHLIDKPLLCYTHFAIFAVVVCSMSNIVWCLSWMVAFKRYMLLEYITMIILDLACGRITPKSTNNDRMKRKNGMRKQKAWMVKSAIVQQNRVRKIKQNAFISLTTWFSSEHFV